MSDGNSHFLMALGRHDDGGVIERADEMLSELIKSVYRTGGAGEMTLKLKVKPAKKNGYEVTMSLGMKEPALPFQEAFYWADANGQLTRDGSVQQLELEGYGESVTPIRKK